jgi:phosphotransferase system HPr-like phosphotransfer protein
VVELDVSGEDEQAAMAALLELINNRFDEAE